jgi:cell division protein FtsQ
MSPRERRTAERRTPEGERRAGGADRQRRLKLVPADLPPLESDEPPFLRPERRTRVRRARRGLTARLIFVLQAGGVALVALFAMWGAYSRVMAAERLKVAHVEVRGGHFLSEAEVRDLLGPALGENILSLDIGRLTARLRSSPWVAEATVARSLPDTLRVQVRERAPLALAEVERLYLMDGEGVLIDVYGPQTAGFDLPIVRGLARADEEERRRRAQRAGELLRDLGPLAAELSELEVDEKGDVRVVLRGAGERLLLGGPPYRGRLLDYLGLRAELLKRCPDAEWFDLRFRDRIVARSGGRWPEKEKSMPAEGQPAAGIAPPPAAEPAAASPPPAPPAVLVPARPSGTDAGSGAPTTGPAERGVAASEE